MANEITIQSNIAVSNGGLSTDTKQASYRVNQTTAAIHDAVHTITTTEAALSFPTITTKGYLWLKNLDSTNFVTFGPESGGAMVPFIKLAAGETAGPMEIASGVTIRADADTASCKVRVVLTES